VLQGRNANFSLSQSNRPEKLSNVTSATHAFTPDKLAMKDIANVGNPLTMRVANFKVGFEKQTSYSTAAAENNKFVAD